MNKLALTDPRWGEMTHAFGNASDIPPLLKQLDKCMPLPGAYQDEPLCSLWQSLCHQGVPCTASYGAVPHLLEIAVSRPPREGEEVLHLVGCIIAFQHRGPQIPVWLEDTYKHALEIGAKAIRDWLCYEHASARAALLLLADYAALIGEIPLARAMLSFESGEVDIVCMECGTRSILGLGKDGLDISPMEWTQRASMDGNAVTSSVCAYAQTMGHISLSSQIADLNSVLGCARCGCESLVSKAILAASP